MKKRPKWYVRERDIDPFFPGFDQMRKKYGASHATTYWVLRRNGQTCSFAHKIMHSQIKALGLAYAGGLECVPFRAMRENV